MAGTATDRPLAVLTATAAASVLTAAVAVSALTAGDRAGGGGYQLTYPLVYPAAAAGNLTASDTRTGGPG
jgi:hypothetical protein